ncbi:chemotaxis protein MotB [Nitrosospira sp. Nl5]|uniref:flagellar motor protein MotB n=1 Tax=Nitrosospira sp. Nl5 TaxID=200120 RepID=UPI00088F8415|nr:flagellar motor protein MotB [Nitrosospira sp. Nl5]SCY06249.1 chemotaxis protein MotB [Nitrosospira sp. Nl5]
MANDLRRIVVKKIKKGGADHGGQWKIAYADFITAMMAFFLLMWLLSSSTREELEGVSEYFRTPLQISPTRSFGNEDKTSLIQGGGKDLTRREGQVRKADFETGKRNRSLKAAQAELEALDTLKLENLKKRLERLIESHTTMRDFKEQLLLDITSEGLRIQIVDDRNRPMFALARAELQPYTKDILQKLGGVLNEMPNRVSLSGHTDATVYANGEKSYSNWELSADRANASRRQLIMGGMNEQKIMRVVGLSSAVLFDKNDPTNPVNRRISIIVMSNKAADALSKEGGTTREVRSDATVNTQTLLPPEAG